MKKALLFVLALAVIPGGVDAQAPDLEETRASPAPPGHAAYRTDHRVLFLRSDHLLKMIHQSVPPPHPKDGESRQIDLTHSLPKLMERYTRFLETHGEDVALDGGAS